MRKEGETRTEIVAMRLTPVEKLRLMQAARKPKYQGSISNLLRDLLSGTVNDKSTDSGLGTSHGALVNANN